MPIQVDKIQDTVNTNVEKDGEEPSHSFRDC